MDNSNSSYELRLAEIGADILDVYEECNSSGGFEPMLSEYSDDSVEPRLYVEFPPEESLTTELRVLTRAAELNAGYIKLEQTSTDHKWIVQFIDR